MNRLLDFRDPDNMLAGVLVIVLVAVMVWMLMFAAPYGAMP